MTGGAARGYTARAVDTADDALLLANWREGDREAGTRLFRRHFAAVRRFFRNKVGAEDVEDLVQRSFAGLVESMPRFRGEASFRVLLFAIAHRQLYKFLRDRARHNARLVAELRVSSVQALGLSPSGVLAVAEEQELVQRALQRIRLEYQVVIELYYWEEIAAAEIAAVLGIQQGTVRTRLHRARAALDEELRLLRSPRAPAVDIEAALRELGARI